MINNNWLTWILVGMLRTYNLTKEFLRYEFNKKLLNNITLFRVISTITWTQPIYIYIYIYNYFLYIDYEKGECETQITDMRHHKRHH